MPECQRCGQPVQPPLRKYCSDACRDSYQRDQARARSPRGTPRRTYRVYDYRRGQA